MTSTGLVVPCNDHYTINRALMTCIGLTPSLVTTSTGITKPYKNKYRSSWAIVLICTVLTRISTGLTKPCIDKYNADRNE